MASWWQGVAGLGARRTQEALCQSCQFPAHAQYLSALAALSLGWGLPVF